MVLNDQTSDEQRQRLLPYVTRLACADTPEIESARAAHIHQHTRGYPYGIPMGVGLEILDGALAMGRQADPLGPDEVLTRMDVAKSKVVKAPPSAPKRSLAATVKSWLARKETESTS
jgi:hypothetical protein